MTEAPRRMASVRAKTERAEEHFRDLEVTVKGYLDSRPYAVVTYEDKQSGDKVFVLRVREDPNMMVRLGVIVGDVLHNLRSALDHLVWQLVEANGGTPDGSTALPISDSAQKFEAALGRKVQ